jgi:hypothetical protein
VTDLATRFHAEMLQLYADAKAAGYTASYFHRMVDDLGGVAAAKRLINDSRPSDGFTRLWEMRRLDLSIEALATRAPWKELFTPDERRRAEARLREYGHDARRPTAR